jgi:hypothetical protein
MQRAPAAALLLLLWCGASAVTAQPQAVIPQTARYNGARPGSSAATPARYTLDVTAATRAPDCFTRRVILVNGEFMPTLEVTQGDFVEVRGCACAEGPGWLAGGQRRLWQELRQ